MTHDVEESDWLAEGSKLIEEDVDEFAAEIDR